MTSSIRTYVTRYYPFALRNTSIRTLSENIVSIPSSAIIANPDVCQSDDPHRYERYQYFLDQFISTEMQRTILRDYRCIRTVEYTCESPTTKHQYKIIITYYLPISRRWSPNSQQMRLINAYVSALFVMFFYLEHIESPYLKTVRDAPVQIYFCPTLFKKKITKEVCMRRPSDKPFVFDYDMVNSGYTSHATLWSNTSHASGVTGADSGYIVIYRYEEFNRLLFHECIHYMGIDGVNTSWTEWQSFRDDSLKNVKGELRVFESYTDTWAIYWNILIYQFLIGKTSKTAGFTALWKKELQHQRDIVEYCMKCIGSVSLDTWIPNAPADTKREWIMKTPTFAYYILKHGAFLRGSTKICNEFPFGATLWSRDKMQLWYQFCIDGIKPVSDKYRPRYRAEDVPTTMSAIGFQ